MPADTDTDPDIHFEWLVVCDSFGAIVEISVGWPISRPTPRTVRDLADRLIQIADSPLWWMPPNEAP